MQKDLFGFHDRAFMRQTVVIGIPIMLQQLINTAMYMVDTVMIGGLGDIPLAAVGAANQLAYLLDIALFGVMAGAGIYMAQYKGKQDIGGIRSTLGLSVLLCSGFSILFVILARTIGGGIVGLYSRDPAVVEAGVDYLSIACFGYLAKPITYSFGTAHKTTGNAKLPMLSGAAAISVNIAALMTPGHRIIGIIEGDSDPQQFIPELIAHHAAGRFPFDRLIKTFPLDQINEAIAAQVRGEVIKVVLR